MIEERIERLLGKVPTLPTPQNETYNVFLENWWETGKIVYQLAGSQQDKLTGRHQLAIISAEKGYKLMSLGNDPFFHLSEFKMDGAMLHIMRIELTVPEATVWQVFYPETKRKPKYHKENSISGRLQKGDNTIYVLIDGKNLQGQIRIDPGAIAGEYFLKTIEVRAVDSL